MELTKHISLAQMYPAKLIELIATKETILDLEEFVFDMDYPGQYMRRIKSVSVTISNVAGPYTTVSFMLTLQRAKVRKESRLFSGQEPQERYDENNMGSDPRFVYQTGGNIMQSICTSSAQNDSGLFELNFGDERYLPFENAGIISTWALSFPAACNQFDISTVSDVILHINYTALYDGNLANTAKLSLQDKLPEFGTMLLSPKQDFPDSWNLMDNVDPQMNFEIRKEHLPFFMRGREWVGAEAISMLLSVLKRTDTEYNAQLAFTIKGESITLDLQPQENGDILIYSGVISLENLSILQTWDLQLSGVSPADIKDILTGFSLIAGDENNDTGDGEGGGDPTDNESFLLTNSFDKVVTNNNQNIILNN